MNAYTKKLIKAALASKKPKQVVKMAFDDQAEVIQKKENISVLRAQSGTLYVVSSGTVLKWETALKKALELIAQEPTWVTASLIIRWYDARNHASFFYLRTFKIQISCHLRQEKTSPSTQMEAVDR